jgi:hypothetical protein
MSGQLHFELDASTKLFTELTTLAASRPTVATCVADGLDGRAASELLSASTEDVMAPVSFGKSLLADRTHRQRRPGGLVTSYAQGSLP